jgi:transcriptional regulator with XRE-family HTH domain
VKKNTLKKNAAFGMRLKAFRQALKISQAELADHCGLTQRTVSNMETGYNSPLMENVEKIFLTYPNLSEDWLKKGVGPMLIKSDQLTIDPKAKPYPILDAEERFVNEQSQPLLSDLDEYEKKAKLRRQEIEAQKQALNEEQAKIDGKIEFIKELRQKKRFLPNH